MDRALVFTLLVIFSVWILFQSLQLLWKPMPAQKAPSAEEELVTQWAVLVAGSFGFSNYCHQADVCHAYQILRKGGMKDENIIVFMYDDLAYHPKNPRPGIIINHPKGHDVYFGVPKDYTGDQVNTQNLYAVFLGNKSAVHGGSGKVLASKPNDRIFVYIVSHGSNGFIGMPNMPNIIDTEFISLLKTKHESNSYKSMLIYVEACSSGSIFFKLPEDLNVYVNTASNAEENSFGMYCPFDLFPPPYDYLICLGDLFSVSWMENSERKNLKVETVGNQYKIVKERTSVNDTYKRGSHVMEFGTKSIKANKLYLYLGFDPSNAVSDNSLQ